MSPPRRPTKVLVAVRKKLSIACLFIAWLCANGALLESAQLVAWTKMVHDNARLMPFPKAVLKTLDGSAPCEICSTVDELRQQQSAPTPYERAGEKLVLACELPETIASPALDRAWPPALALAAPARTEAVPVPPPRA